MQRIALLDAVGDAGIGGYTHELAEALCNAGLDVDVYTIRHPFAERLQRSYALIRVLGGSALDVASLQALTHTARRDRSSDAAPPATAAALDAYFDVLARRASRTTAPGAAPSARSPSAARAITPSVEEEHSGALAEHLSTAGYDTVWTQWAGLAPYAADLRDHCAAAGLRVVHTVHNVLPHERATADVLHHQAIYSSCDALVVHSRQAAASLESVFPELRSRIVESRHGTYSIYPRVAGARERVRSRLDLPDDAVVALLFGGVRPYKNVDAVLAALRDDACANIIVVVAGWEWGYDEHDAGDRLARTRRIGNELGVSDRLRLLPGPFGIPQTSALFEASDIVALPYLESFGSGVLCLGMTFERQLLVSRTGGMAEYLVDYAAGTVLSGTGAGAVAEGLASAASAAMRSVAAPSAPPALAWPAIVTELIPRLAAVAPRTPVMA